MPVWGSVYFQESISPLMEQLEFFHNHIMVVVLLVMVLVGYVMGFILFNCYYGMTAKGGQVLESFWTVTPVLFLLFIALPSLRLLYMMEEGFAGDVLVKAVGYQWYWLYEVPGFVEEETCYMKSDCLFRNLETDSYLVLPYLCDVRVLVTSMDVIHSWTISSVGVSVDAIPGRINQVGVRFNSPGWFVGQCSEICGANHSFMPVFVSVVSREDFLLWWA